MSESQDAPSAHHRKAYVCIHVFEREREILLVSRPDGDWCLLCGEDHPDDPSYFRVVGMEHFTDEDDALREVLDLDVDEEAERDAPGGRWVRSRFA